MLIKSVREFNKHNISHQFSDIPMSLGCQTCAVEHNIYTNSIQYVIQITPIHLHVEIMFY